MASTPATAATVPPLLLFRELQYRDRGEDGVEGHGELAQNLRMHAEARCSFACSTAVTRMSSPAYLSGPLIGILNLTSFLSYRTPSLSMQLMKRESRRQPPSHDRDQSHNTHESASDPEE